MSHAAALAVLRESEQRLRLFVEYAPVALAMFDGEMRYLAASRLWAQLYLGGRDDFIGQSHYELFPACPARWRADHVRGLAGEVVRVEEDCWTLPSGEQLWAQYEVRPWRDADGAIGGICIYTRNITEQKLLEQERHRAQQRLEQAQRLQSLGVLAGGIAHDFNNLMMGILGYSELLRDQLPAEIPATESIQSIKRASLQAAELCKQLLDYAGRGKSTEISFSINELLTGLRGLLCTCITKNCTLQLHLAPDIPAIQGDPSQIRQVILNFVVNASEAIGNQPGEISLVTGKMNWEEDYLDADYLLEPVTSGLCASLEVHDTGCGMAQQTLGRIFDPFFSTKRAGRGLGLSAVIGIIRAHQGGLCVRTEPNRGTTFRVVFPAADGLAAPAAAQTKAQPNSDWKGQGTVLLVDDEELVRNATTQLLKVLGLSVVTAADGLEAIDIYRSQAATIDLVLLDLTMPRMGGEEALRELQRIDPNVQVVVVSGYSESSVPSLFAGQGIAGCLHKPLHAGCPA